MAVDPKEEPPFEGGAQPVPERPPEAPTPGRTALQYVVLVVAALVILAGLLYLFSMMGTG